MPKSGNGKSSAKPGQKTAPVTRRDEIRKNLPREHIDWTPLLNRRETYLSIIAVLAFVVAITALVRWTSRYPLISAGQIARSSFVARVPFEVFDLDRTEKERELARQRTNRIYRENQNFFQDVRPALLGLPKALAGKTSLDEVNEELVIAFNLTPEALAEIQTFITEDQAADLRWQELVNRFIAERLSRLPIIESERWQVEQTLSRVDIKLIPAERPEFTVPHGRLTDIADANMRSMLLTMLRDFPEAIQPVLLARIERSLQPTYLFDEAATRREQEVAAAQVPDRFNRYERGTLLYVRGDVLTPQQVNLVEQEHEAFLTGAPRTTIWMRILGASGVVLLITLVAGGYLLNFDPRVVNRTGRLASLLIVISVLLALTCTITVWTPSAIIFAAATSTLLVAVVFTVGYNRPTAMALATAFAVLVCLALRLPAFHLAMLVGGAWLMVWQLREIRDRNRLIEAGLITGLALAATAVCLGLLDRPVSGGFVRSLIIDAVEGAASGLIVGFFTLGILSFLERGFNVITSLSLVELRDPGQPLLRELQQRAPGTYNHSLQVANIAEAAAKQVRADPLLTYVGALYHDIGKMNKPEYFVENQQGSINRHQKLSPAMSLLIIIGHVKDGIEMAREANLPRPIHHFIEAHHGTTVVEYFYHLARERAEAGGLEHVSEAEYRYPGPRPRTKEVAIVMIADAVESTTRTLTEPTPSRIEQLVRGIARKRLLDNQLDDCDLTLRELRIIEDSLIKSLCAIYHTRITYPAGEKSRPAAAQAEDAREPATAPRSA